MWTTLCISPHYLIIYISAGIGAFYHTKKNLSLFGDFHNFVALSKNNGTLKDSRLPTGEESYSTSTGRGIKLGQLQLLYLLRKKGRSLGVWPKDMTRSRARHWTILLVPKNIIASGWQQNMYPPLYEGQRHYTCFSQILISKTSANLPRERT